jgi:Carboxypeptidase regulatory-like domain
VPILFQKGYMKTKANFGRLSITALGVILSCADFVSAAVSSKNINPDNQRTGSVTGKLTGTFGNQVVSGLGETVTLTSSSGGQAVTTKTNAEGRYLFQNVPPGQYVLRTQFEWTTTYVERYEDGTVDRMYVDHSRRLVAQVQVKPRQTSRATNLTVGPTQDGRWAYGGWLLKPHHTVVTND